MSDLPLDLEALKKVMKKLSMNMLNLSAFLALADLSKKFLHGLDRVFKNVAAAIWLSLATRDLPQGVIYESAKKIRDKAFTSLDEKSRIYVLSRVRSFVPLKQTENTLSDKPKKGIGLYLRILMTNLITYPATS